MIGKRGAQILTLGICFTWTYEPVGMDWYNGFTFHANASANEVYNGTARVLCQKIPGIKAHFFEAYTYESFAIVNGSTSTVIHSSPH